MQTYTKLSGRVLDLGGLTDEEQRYFRRAYARAWKAIEQGEAGVAVLTSKAFSPTVYSARNPALKQTDGWITPAVWDHPLLQALIDLADRLEIAQGLMRPSRGDFLGHPLEDKAISVTEAAKRKRVTRRSVHLAVERGDVLGWPTDGAGSTLELSANSVKTWKVQKARQAAGQAHGKRKRAKTSASAA